MMTNAILTIHRQLARARRRLSENDAKVFAALAERGIIEDEIAELQQRYMDALEAPRLAEQGQAAVAEAVRVMGGGN